MKSIYILGRQPDIGVAELEALFGHENIRAISSYGVASNLEPDTLPFSRLGGSQKVCKVLTTLPYTSWNQLVTYLLAAAPQFLDYLPDGKLTIGMNCYGFDVSAGKINASMLSLKKIVKASGKSVRIVPNKAPQLNSAQIIHNKLTGPQGWDLNLIKDGNQTILAQTVTVQDIEAYAARDQARPKRDARVGMLPPKLAQTIINLASIGNNRFGAVVLDPFCGTGVILQEALLMGFNATGSDIDSRIIDFTDANLEWLQTNNPDKQFEWQTFVRDAIQDKWPEHFDFVAAETFLGRPLSSLPDEKTLNKIIDDCDFIHKKFLANIANQAPSGTRLCLAVPAWILPNRILHLKTLDSLEKLSYNRQSFVHADNKKLIYYRESQRVGRELVVLIRK